MKERTKVCGIAHAPCPLLKQQADENCKDCGYSYEMMSKDILSEDYIYEVCDESGEVLDTDYVALDAAIEYALENGGYTINKIWFELRDVEVEKGVIHREEGETIASEVIWERDPEPEFLPFVCEDCQGSFATEHFSIVGRTDKFVILCKECKEKSNETN